jgi:hypothetical protein
MFRALVVVLPFLVVLGCGARPGDSCVGNDAVCENSAVLLECEAGRFFPIPCRGVDGCFYTHGSPICDASLALDGDACAIGEDGLFSCTVDLVDELQCQAGYWVTIDTCPGATQCTTDGTSVSCQ